MRILLIAAFALAPVALPASGLRSRAAAQERSTASLDLEDFVRKLRADKAKDTPYEKRGERFEGFVRRDVSYSPTDTKASLEPLSLVRRFSRFSREDDEWLVRWPKLREGRVWLHAELQYDETYRMDALPEAGSGEFRWSLAEIHRERLEPMNLKLRASLIGPNRMAKPLGEEAAGYLVPSNIPGSNEIVLLPVTLEAASAESGLPRLKIFLRANRRVSDSSYVLRHYRSEGGRELWHRLRKGGLGKIYHAGETFSIPLLTLREPSLPAGYHHLRIRFESSGDDDPDPTDVVFLLPEGASRPVQSAAARDGHSEPKSK